MPKKIGTGFKAKMPKIIFREYKDVCVSLDCGKPRKKPSLPNWHDPRFHPFPKPKIKKNGHL